MNDSCSLCGSFWRAMVYLRYSVEYVEYGKWTPLRIRERGGGFYTRIPCCDSRDTLFGLTMSRLLLLCCGVYSLYHTLRAGFPRFCDAEA